MTKFGNDAMESLGYLKFTDESMKSNFLQSLSTMRRHRLFCDVILLSVVASPLAELMYGQRERPLKHTVSFTP
ncbi:ns1 binding protein [Culex quinquefasciatus]|uniref:Ns1 binding protein n=1 Tax=Culex quinquefasciatus TaxID=7176 RepID=B0XBK3_CULQU|nr:ns1 binding protein [Culex quinquefasciatus]|eukprot:XP_001867025.1 ns1 binding protein [Culex quinquefasciatus]